MSKSQKNNNNDKEKLKAKELILQRLLISTHRNRFWITVVILSTFILISTGIILAVSSGTNIDPTWKEILLLMLGAFIGWAGKVIEFWFTSSERDLELLRRADEEDDYLTKDAAKDEDELKVGETSDPQLLNG